MPEPVPANLRLATPSDAGRCAEVGYTAWLETYSRLLPASFWTTTTLESRTRQWTQWLDAGVPVTVAEHGGAIVGYAIAGPSIAAGGYDAVRERQLYALYVLGAHHGTGIGQALLDAVLPPGTPAQLWVAEDNPRARAFYARNGFAPDGAAFADERFAGLVEVRLLR